MSEHPLSGTPSNPRVPVADALRALPLQSPPRSVWPTLAAQLPTQRKRRDLRLPLVFAATLLLAIVASRFMPAPMPADDIAHVDAPMLSTAATQEAELDTLLRESAQLEAWIAFGGTRASSSGADASLELDLQERIVAIDALLSRPALDPAAQRPLLQERLMRLRQLASVQNTRQLLAANGTDAQAAPVSVF